jgi:hypothetical protein
MAAKLIGLTHKVAIQLHLVAESSTICNSRSRRTVRKLLDTPSYDSDLPERKAAGDVKLVTHLVLAPRLINTWSYTSSPPYFFMVWYLVKQGDSFTVWTVPNLTAGC